MSFNPFDEKPVPINHTFLDWNKIYPKPYNKETVDPYTKTRIILMNGTEFEAQWFSRNFSRHCCDNDLRRELALVRRIEQQQQRRISCLKPKDETILEHTISYEQLAVDLTSELAKQEDDCNVINALNLALLEDFDHLYRYANLMHLEYGTYAEKLVGRYTEIMPARPTISEHRYPTDSISKAICNKDACTLTKLNVGIITAAEQQTMNYYMNVANLYDRSDLGRKLYQEIGMIEEQHVSEYESLKDPNATWLEDLLMHEYTECYLYYSCMMTECDAYIRQIWEECLTQEISHLHKAKELLWKYEKKESCQVIPDGTFPNILRLHSNIDYVRKVTETTVGNTRKKEDVVPLHVLGDEDVFFRYQNTIQPTASMTPSHCVIDKTIEKCGTDYRFETAPSPVSKLRDRDCDNTTLGRNKCETLERYSVCGTTADNCRCQLTKKDAACPLEQDFVPRHQKTKACPCEE